MSKIVLEDKTFTLPQMRKLYAYGLRHKECRAQWLASGHLERALHYETKLEAVVEILENITIFHVGEGFGTPVEFGVVGRFDTFKGVF